MEKIELLGVIICESIINYAIFSELDAFSKCHILCLVRESFDAMD